MEDKYEELLAQVEELAHLYNMQLPGWFREFFDYLFKKNQIILYFDQDTNDLDGFICYWKYGKNRKKWVRDMGFKEDHRFKQMTKGRNVYIPLAITKFDDDLNMIKDSVLKQNENIDSITWHTTDGQFFIHKVRRN